MYQCVLINVSAWHLQLVVCMRVNVIGKAGRYINIYIFRPPSLRITWQAHAFLIVSVCCFNVHQQEEVAKNLLAEFNLGCDAHRTEHVYRVYVSTFLGFGGNAARQRYEENLISSTRLQNK